MASNINEKRAESGEGTRLLDKVRSDMKRVIKVNPEFQMPRIHVKEFDNSLKKHRCCMCGEIYPSQKGNFLSGGSSFLWKGNNGYLPFCKSCCETLMEMLTSFYGGNEEHALRHICQMFGWYYSDMASTMTLSQVHFGKSRVSLYPSKACTRQVATRGTTILDTIREENANNEAIQDISDLPEEITGDEEEFVVTKDVVRRWGRGYTPEQYEYLEAEYGDWCAKNICNTKTQEELYKNIAIAQLNIRTAQTNGNAKAVSEAMDALQKLMNSANILPRQTAENLLADTQTFGTLLKKYEETDPIPDPDERWKDVDGIRRYMNTWFRGGLAKALKINNENTALYDEAVAEMQKYTVQPVGVGDADINDASIFDNNVGAEEDLNADS